MLILKYCILIGCLVLFNQVTCDIFAKNITEEFEDDSQSNDSDIVHDYYDDSNYNWDPFTGKTLFLLYYDNGKIFFKISVYFSFFYL